MIPADKDEKRLGNCCNDNDSDIHVAFTFILHVFK